MFFDKSKLVKLIKDSYKNGSLRVGNLKGGLVVTSGHWLAWINNNYIPNKIKATIIELTGGFPVEATIALINKDGTKQIEEPKKYESILEGYKLAMDKLIETPVILEQSCFNVRAFQNIVGDITGIREDYFSVIDKNAIDLNIEGEPVGPCYSTNPMNGIYWYNGISALMILPYKLRENELTLKLSEIDFSKEE